MRRACSASWTVGVLLFGLARPCTATSESHKGLRPPSHHLGLTLSWTHAFVARSVSHEALGLAGEMFFWRRMVVALVGTLYSPFQRAHAGTPSAFPLNETLGSVFPEVRVTLLRGERGDLAVGGGAGVLASRPISLVDQRIEGSNIEGTSCKPAVPSRVFLLSDLALSLEARHASYVEARESRDISASARGDPSTWLGEMTLTNVFEVRLGLTVFAWRK